MIFKDLIEELTQKEIEISFSGGKLKYSGPEKNITPELLENLKEYKGKLIKYFWPKEFDNLMPINTEGSKVPIFIVHGDNSNYIISEHLGPDQPIYGFFHPGSEGEAITFKGVPDMAATYLEKVLAVSPSGPYYLIGFSYGGVLAYEMAVQLQKSGHNVPFLVLIDSASPLARELHKPQKDIFQAIRANILHPVRIKWRQTKKLLFCYSYLWRKKPIPAERRKDYMYLKYLNFTKKYIPDKFDGDILLFRTTEHPSSSRYIGWDSLVNNIRLVEVEGKHLEIFVGKEKGDILRKEIEDYLAHVKNFN
jgi:thioesterase domain-containing protein